MTDLVGAEPHQRTAGRTTYRNGYREREWDTRVGTLELQIPELRRGTYFPSLLEPRRRHERALLSVVQEAYIHGVASAIPRTIFASSSRMPKPGRPRSQGVHCPRRLIPCPSRHPGTLPPHRRHHENLTT